MSWADTKNLGIGQAVGTMLEWIEATELLINKWKINSGWFNEDNLIDVNPFRDLGDQLTPDHLLNMLQRMKTEEMHATKRARWVGWIQAGLLINGILTFEEICVNAAKYFKAGEILK